MRLRLEAVHAELQCPWYPDGESARTFCCCACRYTIDRKPNKPQSAAAVVAQATLENQNHSMEDPAGLPTSQSSACSSFDPDDWPFALRTPEAADAVRSNAYHAARLSLPSEETDAPIPKQITIVSAASGEVVSNKVFTTWRCFVCNTDVLVERSCTTLHVCMYVFTQCTCFLFSEGLERCRYKAE